MNTPKQFYKYYESKPDDQWCVGEFHSDDGKQHCALGFLRHDQLSSDEYKIESLFSKHGFECVPHVNDGNLGYHRLGNTPKERVLKAISIIIEKLAFKRKNKAKTATGVNPADERDRIALPSLQKETCLSK